MEKQQLCLIHVDNKTGLFRLKGLSFKQRVCPPAIPKEPRDCLVSHLLSLSWSKVLDGMGLGPSGPPIPPPVTYSVVSLPSGSPEGEGFMLSDCFSLLDPSYPGDFDAKDNEEDAVESLPPKVTHCRSAMRPYAGLTRRLTRMQYTEKLM